MVSEMMRFGPLRWLTDLEHELEPWWGRRRRYGWRAGDGFAAGPACDMLRSGDDLIVRVELPGIDPERDVQVTIDDGMLCIIGERRPVEADDRQLRYRRESWVGPFERGIRLPAGVDPGKVTSHYTDGVLEIRVPHGAVRGGRKVPIVTVAPTATTDTTQPAA